MTALYEFTQKKTPVSVFMSNGFKMKGVILEEEPEYIVIREIGCSGRSILFKNQISTIKEIE